jgi:beta-lactamase regulating signal transducer with metallopeptidase domain
MVPADVVFDAFIDANILLVVAFTLWSIARLVLGFAGFRHAYAIQLQLLNVIFLTIVIAPFVIVGIGALQQAGVAQNVSVNLSDMVVSYFLNGGIEMRATDLERLLAVRDTVSSDVLGASSWVGIAIIVVFAGGVIYGLGRLFYSILCLYRIVSSSFAWRSFGRVRLRLSDRTLVPFSTRGLRNYYVVIPTAMLGSAEELKVSLAHEFQHLRQGDIGWEIVLEALKPLFFLNPAYHAWKRRVEDLRELSCDARVLGTGRIDVKVYAETLLNVCQQSLRRDRVFVVAMPKVTLVTADRYSLSEGRTSFLERRIMTLIEARTLRHPRAVFAVVALPVATAVMLAAMAIQSPGDWSHDRLMLSTVVNLERLDEINRLSTFGRARD